MKVLADYVHKEVRKWSQNVTGRTTRGNVKEYNGCWLNIEEKRNSGQKQKGGTRKHLMGKAQNCRERFHVHK